MNATKEKTDVKADGKSPVHRSPNYPAFTLEEAIKKAKVLWDKDHRVGAHRDIVLKHLGYSSESGNALRTLATLRRFDLITEKEGRIMVSQKALDILLYPQNDLHHKEGLRKAALNPSIYNDLYSKYKWAFPSDETLKAELIRDYGFNPKQVDSFLGDFRETLKYAELDRPAAEEQLSEEEQMNREITAGTGKLNLRGGPAGLSGSGAVVTAGALSLNKPVAYSVPLKRQNEATLSFKKFPLEKADLALIKSWLELMEENLTEQPVPEEDATDLL